MQVCLGFCQGATKSTEGVLRGSERKNKLCFCLYWSNLSHSVNRPRTVVQAWFMPIAKVDVVTILLFRALTVALGCVHFYKNVGSVKIFVTTGLKIYQPFKPRFLSFTPHPAQPLSAESTLICSYYLMYLFTFHANKLQPSYQVAPQASSACLDGSFLNTCIGAQRREPRLWIDFCVNTWHVTGVR